MKNIKLLLSVCILFFGFNNISNAKINESFGNIAIKDFSFEENYHQLDKLLIITKDKRKSYIIAKVNFDKNKPENIFISEDLKNKILNFGMNVSNSEELLKLNNYKAINKIIEDEIRKEVVIDNIELNQTYSGSNDDRYGNNIFLSDKILVMTKDRQKAYIIVKVKFGKNNYKYIPTTDSLKNKVLNFSMNLNKNEELLNVNNQKALVKIIKEELEKKNYIFEDIEIKNLGSSNIMKRNTIYH